MLYFTLSYGPVARDCSCVIVIVIFIIVNYEHDIYFRLLMKCEA